MVLNSSSVGQWMREMGEVGQHLADIGAAEGAAGNLSVCVRDTLEVRESFPQLTMMELPTPVPDLAGATVLVTGSGRRLREIAEAPTANLAAIVVEHGGKVGRMFTAANPAFKRVTSEFNTHLAVHHDQMRSRTIRCHAIVHAQPAYLTFLSHIEKYQDEKYLNAHLIRWQPEMILNFPAGLGVVPFLPPGSVHLMLESMLCLREYELVVWSQHGVMARADDSLLHALDLVEYAEAAAHYEVLNLLSGEESAGISPENVRAVAESWNVKQKLV